MRLKPTIGQNPFGLHQTPAGGVARCLSSVGSAGFVQDVAEVTAHGAGPDEQLFGNLSVRLAGNDEAEHLHLSVGEAIGIGGGPGRRLPIWCW